MAHEHDDFATAPPSRSQRKREATRAQALGQRLTELSEALLDALELSEALRQAVDEYRVLRSHEARRRQLQYIGRLMRESDVDQIAAALDGLATVRRAAAERFQDIEQQRERLLAAPDDALPALLAAYPKNLQGRMQRLVRQAREEREHRHPPHAFRALFRLLRTLGEAASAPGQEQ